MVTGPNGAVLYLGGSVHALRRIDYPLPAAYNRAFDASSRLVFEDDPKASLREAKALLRAGTYPKGDTLRNHVDPRTYNYVRRFFALVNVPKVRLRNIDRGSSACCFPLLPMRIGSWAWNIKGRQVAACFRLGAVATPTR
jgi:uncharacterized protein YbaP (TraB family)